MSNKIKEIEEDLETINKCIKMINGMHSYSSHASTAGDKLLNTKEELILKLYEAKEEANNG